MGCNEQLWDLGKDGLPGFASLSLCCLQPAFLNTLPTPTPFFLSPPLCFLKFFQVLSLSLHLQCSFSLCVSKSPCFCWDSTSLSLNLFPVCLNTLLSLLYCTQKLQGESDCVNIYPTESLLKRLCLFFFLQLVLGRMNGNEPDPLAWFVASVTDIICPSQHVGSELLQLSSCHFSFHWYLC